MTQQFEEIEINDALAAALRVSGTVKNADAYDELAFAIARRYAQRTEFNLAVDIADTINDPYTMERTIAEIAVMLAADGQDDGALELIDSLEDFSHQATAKSQIAIAHAAAGEFEVASEIASGMEDNSSTLVAIAYLSADKGEHDRALDILEMLDFPLGSVSIRSRVAEDYQRAGRFEEALELLSQALDETEAIDPPNERVGALTDLALRFNEAGQDERVAEILLEAVEIANKSDESFKDAVLSQIASGYARLKQYDKAVSVTEEIDNVFLATTTLVDLAVIEHEDESRIPDAVLLLTDALDLIVEDQPQTQRDEAQRDYLLTRIAFSFANFGKVDQALKTARAIGALDSRHHALSGVTTHYADSGDFDDALMAARGIEDETFKAYVLTGIGRAMIKSSANEQGLDILSEVSRSIETLERQIDRAQVTANLAVAYREAGQGEMVESLIDQALQFAKLLTDTSAKASALLSISDACANTSFELDDEAVEVLWEITAV